MKLINKINIRFGIAALAAMLLLGTGLSITLKYTFSEQVDEKLKDSYSYIKAIIDSDSAVQSFPPYFEISLIDNRPDTLIYSEIEIEGFKQKHGEIFRQLYAITTINGSTYEISIRESQLETDDFYETIVIVVLVAIFIVLLLLFFLNRRISQSVWKSFYANLELLKSFSIQQEKPLVFQQTDISEFEELNHVLEKMSNKIILDYKNLKQFSEDASHELQTPLAIIRSKLEALLNANELSAEQAEKIQTIYETVNRLTRLNKDLLLLTKLDNNQFVDEKEVLFNVLINEKLEDWQEIIALNNIELSFVDKGNFKLNININLADILVSNILSNAINHNNKNGGIIIKIDELGFSVLNEGNIALENSETIFNRFHKDHNKHKSVGLGLAIAKKICENYKLNIAYSFTDKHHAFSVTRKL